MQTPKGFIGKTIDRVKGVFTKSPTAADYFADLKNWKNVSSSNWKAYSYFLSVQKGIESVLAVRFLDGSEYWYFGVSISVVSALAVASSKGRFGHQHIYGKYRQEKQ